MSAARQTNEVASDVWFKLLLCDISKDMIAAWKEQWQPSRHVPVEYFEAPFQDIQEPFDCIVSPANSFGLMDGGIDYYISQYFGGVKTLVPWVQKAILDEFCGQQPVGTSFIIKTDRSEGCRFIAHTPTMRMPRSVAGTDIAYRAMWSMLLAVRNHNRRSTPEDKISSVLCSGLATGVGGMSPTEAAKQMALAYKHFVKNPADTEADSSSTAPGSRDYLISWQFALDVDNGVQDCITRRSL